MKSKDVNLVSSARGTHSFKKLLAKTGRHIFHYFFLNISLIFFSPPCSQRTGGHMRHPGASSWLCLRCLQLGPCEVVDRLGLQPAQGLLLAVARKVPAFADPNLQESTRPARQHAAIPAGVQDKQSWSGDGFPLHGAFPQPWAPQPSPQEEAGLTRPMGCWGRISRGSGTTKCLGRRQGQGGTWKSQECRSNSCWGFAGLWTDFSHH